MNRFTASVFRKLLSVYVFSYFPFGFEGRMWDLIVSVPDHCLSFYFIPGHSTTFQLIDISVTFENKQYSYMVFCDISKAFDRVWHKGLIFKL